MKRITTTAHFLFLFLIITLASSCHDHNSNSCDKECAVCIQYETYGSTNKTWTKEDMLNMALLSKLNIQKPQFFKVQFNDSLKEFTLKLTAEYGDSIIKTDYLFFKKKTKKGSTYDLVFLLEYSNEGDVRNIKYDMIGSTQNSVSKKRGDFSFEMPVGIFTTDLPIHGQSNFCVNKGEKKGIYLLSFGESFTPDKNGVNIKIEANAH